MKKDDKSLWVVLATVVLALVYLGSATVPPRNPGAMDIHEFGRLPAVTGGREKPFDTIARNTLMKISNRQTFYDNEGRRQPAIKWLLDVIAGAAEAPDHKVFRIDNFELLDALGLEPRMDSKHKFRYAHSEFIASAEKEAAFREQVRHAIDTPPDQRSLYQRKVLDLHAQVQQYYALQYWFEPLDVPPVGRSDEWRSLISVAAEGLNLPQDPEATRRLTEMVAMRKDLILAVLASGGTQELPVNVDAGTQRLARIFLAYHHGDAAAFNSELAGYRRSLAMEMPGVLTKAGREFAFNSFAPFYRCMVLYIIALVMVLIGFLRWSKPLNRAAMALAGVTLIVHTAALIVRMDLMDRWGVFVTNLYSSAVFIGWGCVGLALVLEWFYRRGIGIMVGCITGFASLLIAHNLAADGGDTLEMMQAVLDTNFWLATHVTTVTLGYTATFVAGFLGLLYIVFGLFTRRLDAAMSKDLSTMIYGTICFAILLSFTGTVLGGIWADQSWGRFWGWDPKENGALMIVLWNGLILHARWGAMIRQRGLAVMAIFGNIVTAWSWFGTNELGAGLHSYGFTEGRAYWLMLFVISQLLLMGLGLIPQRFWRSFNGARAQTSDKGGAGALPAPVA